MISQLVGAEGFRCSMTSLTRSPSYYQPGYPSFSPNILIDPYLLAGTSPQVHKSSEWLQAKETAMELLKNILLVMVSSGAFEGKVCVCRM